MVQLLLPYLKVLMQNSGKVLTHTWLLKEIWGIGYQNETHYLRVFINQLRQKIETDSARPKRIVTETGICGVIALFS